MRLELVRYWSANTGLAFALRRHDTRELIRRDGAMQIFYSVQEVFPWMLREMPNWSVEWEGTTY